MEIFQENYFIAQLYSCPKGWENEQSLLAFAVLISKQGRTQSNESLVNTPNTE